MNLPALVRSSQQDVYTMLTILGCTVNCRFRFADCPLIHCADGLMKDATFICFSTSRAYLNCQGMLISAKPSFGDKVTCRYSGFTPIIITLELVRLTTPKTPRGKPLSIVQDRSINRKSIFNTPCTAYICICVVIDVMIIKGRTSCP